MTASREPIRLGRGGEFDVIRSILAHARQPGADVFIGPGDDGLVLQGGWVVSCDLSMEGIHFRREWMSLREMGYRAAAAALSDLAAMAADVEGVVASIAASTEDGAEGVEEVAAGIREAVESVGGAVLGGDLSASVGPLVVDVVALGRTDQPVSRAGAAPGDTVWVTGRLGGAAGAVRAWQEGGEPSSALRESFVRPTPRIAEARWLVERVRLHALIDVSDGVAGDAGHLAAAGAVRIVLDADAIPVHPSLEGGEGSRLDLALRGGEDYELLFTADEESVEAVREDFEDRFGVALTAIGGVAEGEGVFLALPEDGEGETTGMEAGTESEGGAVVPLDNGGFSHFERTDSGSSAGSGGGVAPAPGERSAGGASE
ncbi:MAG: thiamine-phosphate kinase [Longimicrobiales bacterium]|nr:thiamine-phosphate kinase [Longimicrobiales bacterium]